MQSSRPQYIHGETIKQISFRHDRRGPCAWLLNVIWLLLGGWHMFLTWFTTGLILCLSCIAFPCGWQVIKISIYLLLPFGKKIVYTSESIQDAGTRCCCDCINCGFNVVWAVTIGWILALQAILTGLLLMLTIVGIPFGIGCFQLAYVCFRPFGVDFTAEDSGIMTVVTQSPYHSMAPAVELPTVQAVPV